MTTKLIHAAGVAFEQLGAVLLVCLVMAGLAGMAVAVYVAFTRHTWILLAVLVLPLIWWQMWRSS